MLQVALSKPPREVNLEFISLSLSGEPRSAVLNKPALRSYDLREDILSGKKGIILIPGTKLTVTPEKEVIVEFEKYGVGKDQWPGLEICGRVDGALNDGRFDLMTHLVCELEEIGGMGSSSGAFLRGYRKEKSVERNWFFERGTVQAGSRDTEYGGGSCKYCQAPDWNQQTGAAFPDQNQ